MLKRVLNIGLNLKKTPWILWEIFEKLFSFQNNSYYENLHRRYWKKNITKTAKMLFYIIHMYELEMVEWLRHWNLKFRISNSLYICYINGMVWIIMKCEFFCPELNNFDTNTPINLPVIEYKYTEPSQFKLWEKNKFSKKWFKFKCFFVLFHLKCCRWY